MTKSANRSNNTSNIIVIILFCCISFSGCARVPWTDPLGDKQSENIIQIVDELSLKAKTCPDSIDGDITIYYNNIFEKTNVRGYFQILSPSYVKLIISNPFGQPVWLMTSDQQTFQIINTFERIFTEGSVYSYGLRGNMPLTLLRGDWKEWVQGSINVDPTTITDVREDRQQRGTWVTVNNYAENSARQTHLLIKPEGNILLARRLDNNEGKLLAEITYEDWVLVGNCNQPQSIKISDLDYGTEMTIKLSDVRVANYLGKKDFQLKAPPGYLRRLTP